MLRDSLFYQNVAADIARHPVQGAIIMTMGWLTLLCGAIFFVWAAYTIRQKTRSKNLKKQCHAFSL